MSVSLEGKTILITGASSGIGEATARACITAGMHCVINARREDKLKILSEELGSACSVVVGDVTNDGFNQHLLEESGDLYAIFANAGHGLNQSMIDCNMDQCKELFDLNVFSAIELASLAAKQMVKREQGHILFCTSCLSKFTTPQHGVYAASKSAIEAMAKSMQMELKKNHVFVSTVHPIGTRTEFFDVSAVRSGKEKSTFSSQSPSWLMQPPEKVARAVLKCLRTPKPEVWTSLPMRLISTSFNAFPRISSTLLSKFS
jgi:short-subunit dehydrogenase